MASTRARELLSHAAWRVRENHRETIIFANAHLLNLVFARSDLRKWLCDAQVVAAGKGVILGACLFGRRVTQIRFLNWVHQLLRDAEGSGWLTHVVGGSVSVLREAVATAMRTHSGICVTGTHHGFFSPGAEGVGLVRDINEASPDVGLVCCGMLKDEEWLICCRASIAAPVAVAAAGALEFLAGPRREAPRVLRLLWLEWLFRALSESRRLGRRYVVGIPQYLWRLVAWRWGRRNTWAKGGHRPRGPLAPHTRSLGVAYGSA